MSMTYHDKIFLAPGVKRKAVNADMGNEHGIGRSPRFLPGWWLVATGIFYVAVALICIFFLT